MQALLFGTERALPCKTEAKTITAIYSQRRQTNSESLNTKSPEALQQGSSADKKACAKTGFGKTLSSGISTYIYTIIMQTFQTDGPLSCSITRQLKNQCLVRLDAVGEFLKCLLQAFNGCFRWRAFLISGTGVGLKDPSFRFQQCCNCGFQHHDIALGR